jgi:hypothetical protein
LVPDSSGRAETFQMAGGLLVAPVAVVKWAVGFVVSPLSTVATTRVGDVGGIGGGGVRRGVDGGGSLGFGASAGVTICLSTAPGYMVVYKRESTGGASASLPFGSDWLFGFCNPLFPALLC